MKWQINNISRARNIQISLRVVPILLFISSKVLPKRLHGLDVAVGSTESLARSGLRVQEILF